MAWDELNFAESVIRFFFPQITELLIYGQSRLEETGHPQASLTFNSSRVIQMWPETGTASRQLRFRDSAIR